MEITELPNKKWCVKQIEVKDTTSISVLVWNTRTLNVSNPKIHKLKMEKIKKLVNDLDPILIFLIDTGRKVMEFDYNYVKFNDFNIIHNNTLLIRKDAIGSFEIVEVKDCLITIVSGDTRINFVYFIPKNRQVNFIRVTEKEMFIGDFNLRTHRNIKFEKEVEFHGERTLQTGIIHKRAVKQCDILDSEKLSDHDPLFIKLHKKTGTLVDQLFLKQANQTQLLSMYYKFLNDEETINLRDELSKANIKYKRPKAKTLNEIKMEKSYSNMLCKALDNASIISAREMWKVINIAIKPSDNIWLPRLNDSIIKEVKALHYHEENKNYRQFSKDFLDNYHILFDLSMENWMTLTGRSLHASQLPYSDMQDAYGLKLKIIRNLLMSADLINNKLVLEGKMSQYERKIQAHKRMNNLFKNCFKMSLDQSINVTKIIMLKKKPNVRSYNDVRPIGLNPLQIRTVENIIKDIIYNWFAFTVNKKHKYQYGFFSGSSTQTTATQLVNKLKGKENLIIILYDLKKAYDSINIPPFEFIKSIMIRDFKEYLEQKIRGSPEEQKLYEKVHMLILEWIVVIQHNNDYLVNQDTIINKSKSLIQGSAISPALFNVLIHVTIRTTEAYIKEALMGYADDLALIEEEQNIMTLHRDLIDRLKILGLEINYSKTTYSKINNNSNVVSNQLDLEGLIENKDNQFKYLGFYINHELNILIDKGLTDSTAKRFSFLARIIPLPAKLHIMKAAIFAKSNYHFRLMLTYEAQISNRWLSISSNYKEIRKNVILITKIPGELSRNAILMKLQLHPNNILPGSWSQYCNFISFDLGEYGYDCNLDLNKAIYKTKKNLTYWDKFTQEIARNFIEYLKVFNIEMMVNENLYNVISNLLAPEIDKKNIFFIIKSKRFIDNIANEVGNTKLATYMSELLQEENINKGIYNSEEIIWEILGSKLLSQFLSTYFLIFPTKFKTKKEDLGADNITRIHSSVEKMYSGIFIILKTLMEDNAKLQKIIMEKKKIRLEDLVDPMVFRHNKLKNKIVDNENLGKTEDILNILKFLTPVIEDKITWKSVQNQVQKNQETIRRIVIGGLNIIDTFLAFKLNKVEDFDFNQFINEYMRKTWDYRNDYLEDELNIFE